MQSRISKHADVRFQQRGISKRLVDFLHNYGKADYAPGGALKIYLPRREANKIIDMLKRDIHFLERASSVILIQKEGNILTGYHSV